MKDELINAIQPNCLLPFQKMAIWLDNVVLLNDPTGGVRQQIKSSLRSSGQSLPSYVKAGIFFAFISRPPFFDYICKHILKKYVFKSWFFLYI